MIIGLEKFPVHKNAEWTLSASFSLNWCFMAIKMWWFSNPMIFEVRWKSNEKILCTFEILFNIKWFLYIACIKYI